MKGYEISAADRPPQPPQPPRGNLNSASRKREEDLESVDSFWGVGGVSGGGISSGGVTITATSETPTGKPQLAERTPGLVTLIYSV